MKENGNRENYSYIEKMNDYSYIANYYNEGEVYSNNSPTDNKKYFSKVILMLKRLFLISK